MRPGSWTAPSGAAGQARLLERNLATLRTVLGEHHPCTPACSVNLADVPARLGEPAGAEALERAAAAGFQAAVGARHPDTVVARANLALTLRTLGRVPEADQLRASAPADFEHMLGEGHPHTVSVREGRRIHQDLEPPLI